MAKIVVEFDTVEKSLVVTMDGKKVKNVSEVEFMAFDEGMGFVELKTFEFMEEEKVVKITKIMAEDVAPPEEAASDEDKFTEEETIEELAKKLFPRCDFS